MAHESGALRTKDLARVTVDTTVQPKDITFPTDAKLLHAAIKGLTRLARKRGVRLRQSYVRIAKRAAMMAGRYAHAKQFNRHRRQLRILRTRLGRLIRDIRRKIAGNAELEAVFAWPLNCARSKVNPPRFRYFSQSLSHLTSAVPTANSKRLTATANRLIVAPNERSFQVDLVRLDRNIPTAGCVASREPCPSTSTHRAAAQIPEAIGVQQR